MAAAVVASGHQLVDFGAEDDERHAVLGVAPLEHLDPGFEPPVVLDRSGRTRRRLRMPILELNVRHAVPSRAFSMSACLTSPSLNDTRTWPSRRVQARRRP
jgi:hypothetical protein